MNLKSELQNIGSAVLAKMEAQQKMLEELKTQINVLTGTVIPLTQPPALRDQHVGQELKDLRKEVEDLRNELASVNMKLKTTHINIDDQIKPLKFQITTMEEDWSEKTKAHIRTAMTSNASELEHSTENFQRVLSKLKRDRNSYSVNIYRRNQYLIEILNFCKNWFSKDIIAYKLRMAKRTSFDRDYLDPKSVLGLAYVKFVVALLTHRSKIDDHDIQAEEFWANW